MPGRTHWLAHKTKLEHNGGGYPRPGRYQARKQRQSPRRELTATQKAQESEKALRYIQQLDDARCAGNWKDVPELCRKVEKHAPHRRCLPPRAFLTLSPTADAESRPHSHGAV